MKKNKFFILYFLFSNFLFANAVYALPAGFVYLHDVDPSILQEMRYASDHNFVGQPIDGYQKNICIVTKETAQALKRVQQKLKQSSLTLKVYDCYRPTRAVAEFMQWSQDPKHHEMKNEFYPRVDKKNLFKLGYIATRSGHSRGSTIDLTIVNLPEPKQEKYHRQQKLIACNANYSKRFADNSIDMGTGYDCMDEYSFVDNKQISKLAQRHRKIFQQLMMAYGFVPYSKEWWHFTYKKEHYPVSYFNFVVK